MARPGNNDGQFHPVVGSALISFRFNVVGA